MTGGSRDVSRILDQLAERVDKLENQGESESEVATVEKIGETAVASDSASTQVDNVEPAVWGSARWNTDTVQ